MASGLPRTVRDAWFAPTVFPVTLQALEDAEDEEQRKVGRATDAAPGVEPAAHNGVSVVVQGLRRRRFSPQPR